jgi:Putative zinc-finger/Trypsin-like peptidase domain
VTEIDKDFLRRLAQHRSPGCPSTAELGGYLDRTASAELRQRIEQHLRGCPACTNELIDLRELERMQHEGEPAPASLVRELDAIKAAQAAPTPREASDTPQPKGARAPGGGFKELLRFMLEPRYVVAAAAVAFVAVIGLAVLRQVPSGPEALLPRGGLDPARLAAARASVAALNGGGASFAGAVVADNALVTLDSATRGAATLSVEIAGETLEGRVVYRDATADLALVRIDRTLPAVRLANDAELTPGTELVALAPGAAEPLRGAVLSSGSARWQTDGGASHEATLLAMQSTNDGAEPGTPVLTASFALAGLIAFREEATSYAIAADSIGAFLGAAPAP